MRAQVSFRLCGQFMQRIALRIGRKVNPPTAGFESLAL